MVKNIENIRLMAESIEETSARVEKMVIEMKATGVIDQLRRQSNQQRML